MFITLLNITLMVKTKWFLGIVFISIIIQSCKFDKTNNSNKTDKNDILFENFVDVENTGVNYRIPSPIELFVLLGKTNTKYLPQVLNKPNNLSIYQTKKAKALNFGIYAADLAYCSVFADNQASIQYFSCTKKLATDLGLYEGFGQTIANRVNQNLNNIDSLIDITSESYNGALQFIEDQGLTDLQGMILAGGWIEGVYITIESVNDYRTDTMLVERVADQQLLLENLINFLSENNVSENIESVIINLKDIQEAFDELYFNNENTIITKQQFVNIANKVKTLRNNIVNLV